MLTGWVGPHPRSVSLQGDRSGLRDTGGSASGGSDRGGCIYNQDHHRFLAAREAGEGHGASRKAKPADKLLSHSGPQNCENTFLLL